MRSLPRRRWPPTAPDCAPSARRSLAAAVHWLATGDRSLAARVPAGTDSVRWTIRRRCRVTSFCSPLSSCRSSPSALSAMALTLSAVDVSRVDASAIGDRTNADGGAGAASAPLPPTGATGCCWAPPAPPASCAPAVAVPATAGCPRPLRPRTEGDCLLALFGFVGHGDCMHSSLSLWRSASPLARNQHDLYQRDLYQHDFHGGVKRPVAGSHVNQCAPAQQAMRARDRGAVPTVPRTHPSTHDARLRTRACRPRPPP